MRCAAGVIDVCAFGVDPRKSGRCGAEVDAVTGVADLDDALTACCGCGKETGGFGGVPAEDVPDGLDGGGVEVGQGLGVEIGQTLGDGLGR